MAEKQEKAQEPLRLVFNGSAGGMRISASKADFDRLKQLIDIACKRLSDGDGSVTVPCRGAKSVGNLTLMAAA